MEVDQAIRTVHAIRIIRKRELASGEIVGSVFGDVTHSMGASSASRSLFGIRRISSTNTATVARLL
jgi:hypothetical protein